MNTFKIIIHFKTFNYKLLNKIINIILYKGLLLNFNIKGPIFLPTKKKLFTVLKSPHVNKKARNQFQLAIHKRMLILYINKSELETFKLFLNFIKNLSSGFQIKIIYKNNYSWKKLKF